MSAVKDTGRRVYGGRTSLERAAARRDALTDAAFALVAQDGWRELSIDAVCRRAGLNKRYFYESFGDLDALVAALTTRLADDAIRVSLAEVDPSLERDEATARAIRAFVEHLTDDPRRARVLFGAVPAGDAAAGHRTAAIRRLINSVATHGRSIYEVPEGPAVELTAALALGGTSQVLLDWLDGRVACERPELIERLVSVLQTVADHVTDEFRPGGRSEQE